jgi:hypothetical protein
LRHSPPFCAFEGADLGGLARPDGVLSDLHLIDLPMTTASLLGNIARNSALTGGVEEVVKRRGDRVNGYRRPHPMHFELLDEISEVETIAIGNRIREVQRLTRLYGKGRWRKRKGPPEFG